ncbi:glycosyltransferase [Aestuariibacter halophilus]|uniref:Glycosyltransferase n=1 Tax=Fluctibacter halophilus TaxID=226011 RepID=A0ABS8GCQ1_9ALTE|nr:glycosyltransferase [Aestuariibacter halophilus]MCC2618337.1 glycosyltransferase [Aestuariibacter halophilus]
MNADVYVMGKLPPPVGGVTKSIANWRDALASVGVNCVFWPSQPRLRGYRWCHVHAYHPYKRALSLLIGKCLARRNVFTIHGMHFDQEDRWNRMALWLCDGVFVLNQHVLANSPRLKAKPHLLTSSVLREGITSAPIPAQPLLPPSSKPYALVYAQHSDSFEGDPIYGIPFVESCLERLREDYTLVLADVTNAYAELDERWGDALVRLDKPVDFAQLLSEVAVYLRPTCKDGDSVAVIEALMAGVPVVASDVVQRPAGVITYRHLDGESFLAALKNLPEGVAGSHDSLTSVEDVIRFLESL